MVQQEAEVMAAVDAALGIAPVVAPEVQEPVWVSGALLDGLAVAVERGFVVEPAAVQEVVLAVALVAVLGFAPVLGLLELVVGPVFEEPQ